MTFDEGGGNRAHGRRVIYGFGPRSTKATHCPWFLKPNWRQPPFLHCSFEVGRAAAASRSSPSEADEQPGSDGKSILPSQRVPKKDRDRPFRAAGVRTN
jgi:hypothetical protein